jgi:hypothetical protein
LTTGEAVAESSSEIHGFIPPGLSAPIKALFLELAGQGRSAGVQR